MVPRLRRTPPPSVPVEPAHSKTATLARIIHDGSSRNCAVATRDGRAESRGGATPRLGVPKGVRSLRGDFRRGLAPPCRTGRGRLQSQSYDGREAYLKQYVDRPNASPPAWTQVRPRPDASPPRLRGRAPFALSWREERIPQWILPSVSAIAAETFMNNAGSVRYLCEETSRTANRSRLRSTSARRWSRSSTMTLELRMGSPGYKLLTCSF